MEIKFVISLLRSYTQNGLLHMLDRNRRIKKGPEKFQLCTERFDIIITAEERVYDQVIEFMESNPPVDNQPVHIINIDIQDNHEEATMGAFLICDMVSMVKSKQFFLAFPYCKHASSIDYRWHLLTIWTTISTNCCTILRRIRNGLCCIVFFSTNKIYMRCSVAPTLNLEFNLNQINKQKIIYLKFNLKYGMTWIF